MTNMKVSGGSARVDSTSGINPGFWGGSYRYQPHGSHDSAARTGGKELAEKISDAVGKVSRRGAIAFPAARIYDEAEELLLSKQDDYGPDNIAKSPFGSLFGLLVRMHDKQARAVNLVSSGAEANHESLEDTFIDMLNYSVIAILCIRGEWPGVKGHTQ